MTFFYVVDAEDKDFNNKGLLLNQVFVSDGSIQFLDDKDLGEDKWIMYKASDTPTMGISTGQQATERIEIPRLDPETGEHIHDRFNNPMYDYEYVLLWEDEAKTIPTLVGVGDEIEVLPYTVLKNDINKMDKVWAKNQFFVPWCPIVGKPIPVIP